MSPHDRGDPRHRFHRLALAAPALVFPPLYLLGWNPIYPGIVALFVGGAATALCRPDLKVKIVAGAGLFVAFYLLFLAGMEWSAPGYIERVWNLSALSGIRLYRFPVEELLFAAGFGACWSGVYEHFTWRGTVGSRE